MFVNRSSKAPYKITGAWSAPQFPGQEEMRSDDGDLQRYVNATPVGRALATLGISIDDLRQALVRRAGLYVDRSATGAVTRVFAEPMRDAHEMLPMDAPEVLEFLERLEQANKAA